MEDDLAARRRRRGADSASNSAATPDRLPGRLTSSLYTGPTAWRPRNAVAAEVEVEAEVEAGEDPWGVQRKCQD
ncbi:MULTISPECIES: hypothetical protein [unclassified Streptomyces]|uniref:hypothetical protein n=1 Tax=unclassified Streptomyces TaxID=2593676 RepID=UPI0013A6D7B3|nr:MULTISPECIES: hypothetical protein [unclassified Streptomyces]